MQKGSLMSSLKDCIKQIENNILKNEGESANLHGESSSSNAIKTAAELEVAKKSILSLKDQIGSIERTINSPRMLVSLERFDKWFYFSLRMQSMRWILIDLSFPMLLGIAATWLLVHQIFVCNFLLLGLTTFPVSAPGRIRLLSS